MNLSHCIFETKFGWMGLQKNDIGLIKSTIPSYSRETCLDELFIPEKSSVLRIYEFINLTITLRILTLMYAHAVTALKTPTIFFSNALISQTKDRAF